jgi:CheY-like chemotaxis protein
VRALVVDDNAQAREILTETLKQFALRADSVASGEDAVRAIAAADTGDPYRLVLMDWHMPQMDGLEASRIIKRDQRLQHIPKILMITAFGRQDVLTGAVESGVDGYLLKPVNASLLYDTLVELFGIAAPGEYARAAAKPDGNEHKVKGTRILVVEDNEINQQVARELLESAGAIVTIAGNGREAIELLARSKAGSFDVVLMDLQMPEMDGYEATQQLRSDRTLREGLQEIPIIAMTAHASTEERQRCLEAGMNDHISKPIDPDALFATLARWTKSAERAIAGVDADGGLRRVAGNRRLYRDLLLQFAAREYDAPARISAALQTGDRKLAERIAHTVGGIAANLGISAIQAKARHLERVLREDSAPDAALLEDFAAVLSAQVQAIERALDRAEVQEPLSRPFDPAEAWDAIVRLKTLLESSDANAVEAFPAVNTAVASVVEKPQREALRNAIDNFEFETALLQLESISNLCTANGS